MALPLAIVLSILTVTVVLIVTETFRIDLVAIMAMLALVWTGSITPEEARAGFSSNAVLAIIGVMIMGRGLFKSGITEKIASFILRIAGRGRRQIISTVSLTVGVMSGFMQNIGAAALFLPVLMGISKREQIPISGLLMPMGFAALLGGTITMVGTSSLIILNDLLSTQGLAPFGLFSVTPIGIVLLVMGIVYFFVLGPFVLPSQPNEWSSGATGQKLLNVWGLSDSIFTYRIPPQSPLIGETIESSGMGSDYNINLLRVYENGTEYDIRKDIEFEPGQDVVVQGRGEEIRTFVRRYHLRLKEADEKSPQDPSRGYLEVVVPARSNLVGQTLRDVSLREAHNVQVVLFFSDSRIIEENIADREVKAGDTLVLQGTWENLQYFADSEDFITVTPFEYEPKRPDKVWHAAGSFIGAIGVVLAIDLPISMGFLTGAVAMMLGGVITLEEAYRAVEWKVIFLIAGLIPIGIAMERSGAAAFIAQGLVTAIDGVHGFVVLVALGLLTTVFSLFMSNVAATVLMVPLVLEIAGGIGISPQALVLQVGVCAANSFIIPTHHVNALLMTPGGYQVSDYLRAGSLLSVLFIFVSAGMLFLLYG